MAKNSDTLVYIFTISIISLLGIIILLTIGSSKVTYPNQNGTYTISSNSNSNSNSNSECLKCAANTTCRKYKDNGKQIFYSYTCDINK